MATPYFDDNSFINSKKKASTMCANCGGYGHLYKSCNHPVISYGIICYNIVLDENTQTYIPKFLMVQRKDSLSYVEFIRGKYCSENRIYLLKLFTNMTDEERKRIINNNFDTLWKTMWCKTEDETNKNFTKEYGEAAAKFNMLQKGYLLKSEEDEIIQFSLKYIFENTVPTYFETEWGFPKGRRNINEDDISCALREFREESGINLKSIRFMHDIKPLEEIFSGSNKVRYKHVYYLSRYMPDINNETNSNYSNLANHCREIKNVGWFTFEEMLNNIRSYNVERKELAKRVLSVIQKKISPRVL
jgi:8-oxo-dGTP pyrophosphatase MutT (NUDIX family)